MAAGNQTRGTGVKNIVLFSQLYYLSGVLRKMFNNRYRPGILKTAALGHVGKIRDAALGHFQKHIFRILNRHEAAIFGINEFLQ